VAVLAAVAVVLVLRVGQAAELVVTQERFVLVLQMKVSAVVLARKVCLLVGRVVAVVLVQQVQAAQHRVLVV
jgi:hypothetical protein